MYVIIIITAVIIFLFKLWLTHGSCAGLQSKIGPVTYERHLRINASKKAKHMGKFSFLIQQHSTYSRKHVCMLWERLGWGNTENKFHSISAVSYTHLTLPTTASV